VEGGGRVEAVLYAPFPIAFLAQSTDGCKRRPNFVLEKTFRASYDARMRGADLCRVDACTL